MAYGLAGSKSSTEQKFLGAYTLENESSREQKFPGQFAPGCDCSREQKFQGVEVPGSELSRVLLETLLKGANWPGSEKAQYPLVALQDDDSPEICTGLKSTDVWTVLLFDVVALLELSVSSLRHYPGLAPGACTYTL